MKTFLQLLAKDIIDKYGEEFDALTILFPNKRAGLFLAEELSRLITRPVWMPEIMTLGEFIGQFTGLRQAETLPLSIKLYKAYASISGSKERFDDFYFWGNMLLGDFDDIDKYLVDARDLFSNLSALKDLENNFPYLNEEQIAAIKKFWSSFHTGTCSREQQEFLQIWDKLYDTYTLFRSSLFEQQLCYEGMNERFFCEHIHEYELHSKRILFAGFNALNRCEKAIFSHYQGLGIASFYWDYDLYYTANEHQEAGDYLRENLKLFPNELGIEHFNNFLHNGKSIKYISVPSNIGQTKLIPDLITQADGATPKTAIVLCDEQLLIPTLHSIPPYIEKINVTMGYPAQKTAVASFIYLLCELKSHAKCEKNQTYYYYKPVVALLNHNFIKALCPSEINQITAYIQTQNIVYVIDKSLYFHPLAQAVFAPSQESLPDYLLRILHLLIQQKPVSEPIEKEFIFSIYSQLQNLQNTFKEEGIQPEEKLYVQIINKAINNITIPFSGEPLEGLQVMGLMETRMLDFKRLVILSANEGTLPKTTLPSSFIPYNLRVGFRLPTPEHQDALFAYYFYRLLQRAEDICILYTSGSKGINSGEMSRYLYQIKYESGLPIRESNFQNLISTSSPKPITIPKTQEIMDILARYEVSGQTALSPSALNTYIECPLRFYFKYVAGIKEPEEIAEELDARLLGTIFHECSQSLYATADGKEITVETIDNLLHTKGLIDQHIQTAYSHIYNSSISRLLDSGNNELILHIVKKYLQRMLEYDKQQAPFRIIAMESRFYVPIPVETGHAPHTVYIGGYIDRVDQTTEGIRVIDYKTGADTTDFKDIPSLFHADTPNRNKAALQTMLYCLMFDHVQPTKLPLIPGIYSTKLLFGKDYNFHLICDKTPVNDFRNHETDYLQSLRELLCQLFSMDTPFSQSQDEKKCKNCSFAPICRK